MAALWPKGWVDSQGLKKALVQANKLRRVKAKEVSTGQLATEITEKGGGGADMEL